MSFNFSLSSHEDNDDDDDDADDHDNDDDGIVVEEVVVPAQFPDLKSIWDDDKIEKLVDSCGTKQWKCHWCSTVFSQWNTCKALEHVTKKEKGGDIRACTGNIDWEYKQRYIALTKKKENEKKEKELLLRLLPIELMITIQLLVLLLINKGRKKRELMRMIRSSLHMELPPTSKICFRNLLITIVIKSPLFQQRGQECSYSFQ